MSDWYCSSVAYAAIPVWAASTALTVGQFIRPTAPAFAGSWVYRCTTAGTTGTTEPTWASAGGANNDTFTNGSAGLTNVTGQSAYGWSACAGTLYTLTGGNARMRITTASERVFVSSDHSETTASPGSSYAQGNGGNLAAPCLTQYISVNRAGSVPPAAADIQSGAAITISGATFFLDCNTNVLWQGFTLTVSGGSSNFNLQFGVGGKGSFAFKNCAFIISNTNASSRFINSTQPIKMVWDNCTVQFGSVSQFISSSYTLDLTWLNTASAIQGATIPTTLFTAGSGSGGLLSVTCRGVDLSAITGTLIANPASNNFYKALFDSCKIASGVNRPGADYTYMGDEIELVNCFDGTNVLNERYTPAGAVTTDRTTYLSGGAQDDIGNYALKLVSTHSDKFAVPFNCFAFDVENTSTGSSKTATVELVAVGTLNNDDVSLLLEYMGTSGNSIASFASTLPAPTATPSALTTSSATWTVPASYTTLNPSDKDTHITLSGGNLTAVGTAGWTGLARAVDAKSAGKFYWETTFNATQAASGVGVAIGSLNVATTTFSTVAAGLCGLITGGNVWVDGASTITIGGTPGSSISFGTISSGTVICIAIDLTAKLIWFRLGAAGNWNNNASRDPAAGTGGVSIPNVGTTFPTDCFGGADTLISNFGASAFTGAAPSGFTSGWPNTPATFQKLQATFTPQRAGRVRGLVRLGKPSSAVWVDPRITIT